MILDRCRWLCLTFAALLACGSATVQAKPRLENICTIQGQQEVRLHGLGLVTGLAPGSGDGTKSAPTVRALRAALTRLNLPVTEAELKNGDSVAVVTVEATIPRTGLRRGQKIDARISAMGAKSLRGGTLLATPLTSTMVRNDLMIGVAGGLLNIEDGTRPTTAKIPNGVDLHQDVQTLFLTQQKGPLVTLLIDPNHASFWTASEVARVINQDLRIESSGKQFARPVGPNVVELTVPPQYSDSAVDFIAQVLDIGIDVPTTQARVILNPRTGTVIVTGEVEISPVIIAHTNFSVEVGNDPLSPAPQPFVGMIEGGQSRQSPQQLKQLVEALNQLRVPAADIISIIRELHNSGKLHAELIER
ncbi:MAG TPA: flagellar basal body P-ring protein FlgI [Planctomycetaceae bacterium]|jgi:flagellar P-ring protein precursor FlgI|nr:flagellar basal body P-ring protein FlgI [Planctomycetaceae bacterium]